MSQYQRGLASPGAEGWTKSRGVFTGPDGRVRGMGVPAARRWARNRPWESRSGSDRCGRQSDRGRSSSARRSRRASRRTTGSVCGSKLSSRSKTRGGDRIAFQAVGPAGQHLLHHVAEKAPAAFAGFKAGTVQDPLQLLANRFRREYARIIRDTGCDHLPRAAAGWSHPHDRRRDPKSSRTSCLRAGIRMAGKSTSHSRAPNLPDFTLTPFFYTFFFVTVWRLCPLFGRSAPAADRPGGERQSFPPPLTRAPRSLKPARSLPCGKLTQIRAERQHPYEP